MTRKQLMLGLVVLAAVLVLVVGYLFLSSGSGSGIPDAAADTAERLAIAPGEHTMGSPKAPIQIVEYGAPICPHCAHFNETVFPLLKKNYIDTGKVYYVFRVYPLHPADWSVEGMASCLPPSSYFQFIDLMFRNQDKWDPEYPGMDVHAGLVSMGRVVGMSEAQVDVCIAKTDVRDRVQKQGQEAMTKYGLESVPSFIIDGVVTSGVVEWDGMKSVLDAKLAAKK